VFLQRRHHVLSEQAHARAAIVVADRSLDAEHNEDAWTQYAKDRFNFRDNGRGRAGDDLKVLLDLLQAGAQLTAHIIVVNRPGVAIFHTLSNFLAADT